jgi:hypothetical protein
MTRELTSAEKEVVKAVANGADIYGVGDAAILRRIQREVPGVVRIMRARTAPKNGAERQPYFGVKATAAGRRLVVAQ